MKNFLVVLVLLGLVAAQDVFAATEQSAVTAKEVVFPPTRFENSLNQAQLKAYYDTIQQKNPYRPAIKYAWITGKKFTDACCYSCNDSTQEYTAQSLANFIDQKNQEKREGCMFGLNYIAAVKKDPTGFYPRDSDGRFSKLGVLGQTAFEDVKKLVDKECWNESWFFCAATGCIVFGATSIKEAKKALQKLESAWRIERFGWY